MKRLICLLLMSTVAARAAGPVLEEQITMAPGEAPNIYAWTSASNYLFGITESPASIIKLQKDNLTNYTVAAFPSFGWHIRGWDMVYVPTRNRLYVAFASEVGFNITEVNPDTLEMTDIVFEQIGGFSQASITSDGAYLYAVISRSPTSIYRYRMETWEQTTMEIPGAVECNRIRYGGDGFLYVNGGNPPADPWLVKVSGIGMQVLASVETAAAQGVAADNLLVIGDYVWLGFVNTNGIVRRYTTSDLTASEIDTGVTAAVNAMTYDGKDVWVMFTDGTVVAIDAQSLYQTSYTLTNGITGLIGDSSNLYASRRMSTNKFYRYGLDEPSAGEFQWARVVDTRLGDYMNGVATDSSGAAIIAGSAQGAPLISKYTTAGVIAWDKYLSSGYAYGAAVDLSDNVYIVGLSNLEFQAAISVSKYNSSGVLQWEKVFDSLNGQDEGRAICIASDGNPVVTGFYGGTIDFDGLSLTNVAGRDFVVFKLSAADGSVLWATNHGGVDIDMGLGVASDASGNIFVCGQFSTSIDFGNGTDVLTAQGSQAFLVKLNSSGVAQWAKLLGTNLIAHADAVVVMTNGAITVTGGWRGSTDFGFGAWVSTGNTDIFICQYDTDGAPVWGRTVGGAFQSIDSGLAASRDTNNNLIIGGVITGSGDFGNGVTEFNPLDGFIAKYTSAGSPIWIRKFGGGSAERTFGVAADSSGNVFACGFYSTADLGDGIIRASLAGGGCIIKYAP